MQIQSQSLNQLIAANQAAGAGVAANLLHLTKFDDKILLGTLNTPGTKDAWVWDYRTTSVGGTMPIACGAMLAGSLFNLPDDNRTRPAALPSASLKSPKVETEHPLRMPRGCDFIRRLPEEITIHSPALYSHVAVLIPLFRKAIDRLALQLCESHELTVADVEAAVAETLNQIANGPSPSRVIISRERGWQAPPGTVRVARPSRWGNPFQIGKKPSHLSRVEALRRFQEELLRGGLKDRDQQTLLSKLPLLKGKQLACWCKAGEPCHADVLRKFAEHLPG